MQTRLNPAKRVIQAFGGAEELARAVGRDVSRIHRWSYPKGKGGTGGAIPGGSAMLALILSAAQQRGISLTLQDLVEAGERKAVIEPAALEAERPVVARTFIRASGCQSV